jgi:hypothetical protein
MDSVSQICIDQFLPSNFHAPATQKGRGKRHNQTVAAWSTEQQIPRFGAACLLWQNRKSVEQTYG